MEEKSRLKEIIGILKDNNIIKDKSPENIRKIIEDLGPTFVKLGQIVSSREDIFSKELCVELKKLKSSVKAMSFEEIKSILEKEYDKDLKEVFSNIDETPIGSASISQVHLATLLDGQKVAVKVQRRNIKEEMALDTKLIKKAIDVLHLTKLTGDIIDLGSVIDEMYSSAVEEMNFFIEAEHINEFRKNNKDVEFLKVMKIYKELSTEEVLVMEYIDGFNINDKEGIKKEKLNMNLLSKNIASNYIKQAIDDGFYHADPHTDNIKVCDGKIVYLDFGMMGRLNNTNRSLLNKCISAIVTNDIGEVSRVLITMNTNDNTIDYMMLNADVSKILDKHKSTEISSINIKEFVKDMFMMLHKNDITLPKEITLLARGIVVLEGTLEEINPNINLISVLSEHYKITDSFNKETLLKLIFDGVGSGKSLVSIPKETFNLLRGINSGELKFNVVMDDSKHQFDRIEDIVHLLIICAIDVALIIGISSMYSSGGEHSFIYFLYVVGSIICTIYLIFKLILNKLN